MDLVARWPAEDRAALFIETAAREGLANPILVEKDFWVCWCLKRLYALHGIPRLLFKGGTSLSKGFGLIQRFSEDIDLSLERADLGFGADKDPASKQSRKGYQQAVEELTLEVKRYVASELVPRVQQDFGDALNALITLELEDGGTESRVYFRYPAAIAGAAYGGSHAYIKPMVLMELGGRADHHPTRKVEIKPYAAAQFPVEFKVPACSVIAQAPERTLLEKALILHSANERRKPLLRSSSRHAYDLVMLARDSATMGALTTKLLKDVAKHKLVFADDKPASEAPTKGVKLVPPEGELRSSLLTDYRGMREMFFTEPPSFEELIGELAKLEMTLRDLGRR